MDKSLFIVEEGESMRLDVYLSQETDFTRSYLDKLNRDGYILVNGEQVKNGKLLKASDRIELTVPSLIQEIVAEDIPLSILYEDDALAVLNKQRGLTVHPAGAIVSGTLVNALMFHIKNLSGINGVIRPGIVHRLDKDTTGVMVIAKNDKAHLGLSQQIASRTVTKVYHALLEGNLKEDQGRIVTKIERSSRDRKLMKVSSSGREAITEYRVLERYVQYCLVEFRILTGRTHQIRVHAQHLGHPIVGDRSYGYKKQKFHVDGQLLHARQLAFCHPITGQEQTFCAPLPDDFLRVLQILKKTSPQ